MAGMSGGGGEREGDLERTVASRDREKGLGSFFLMTGARELPRGFGIIFSFTEIDVWA
jgi:hypothetical protein